MSIDSTTLPAMKEKPPPKQQKRVREEDEMTVPHFPLQLPDQPTLAQKNAVMNAADYYLKKLNARVQDPKYPNEHRGLCESFIHELTEYKGKVERLSKLAFLGTTGTGKTSAICRLLDLMVMEGGQRVPVLSVGMGGTTVCTVHLKFQEPDPHTDYCLEIIPPPP